MHWIKAIYYRWKAMRAFRHINIHTTHLNPEAAKEVFLLRKKLTVDPLLREQEIPKARPPLG